MMSFLLFLFAMYWLPTLIAIVRRAPSALGIAALNFFLGWTVVGWIMALVWALAASPQPQVIVIDAATGRRY
ncbi:MAG TPA: superinfection immunity protein [Rhizomicrobium sp.]